MVESVLTLTPIQPGETGKRIDRTDWQGLYHNHLLCPLGGIAAPQNLQLTVLLFLADETICSFLHFKHSRLCRSFPRIAEKNIGFNFSFPFML